MMRASLLCFLFVMAGAINSAHAARGLPDFTDLVERNSPAVVKIIVEHSGERPDQFGPM